MSLIARAQLLAGLILALALALTGGYLIAAQRVAESDASVERIVAVWNEIAQLRAAGYDFTLSGSARSHAQTRAKLERLDQLIDTAWLYTNTQLPNQSKMERRSNLRESYVATRAVFEVFPTVTDANLSDRDRRTFFLFNQRCLEMTTEMYALLLLESESNNQDRTLMNQVILGFIVLITASMAFFTIWLRRLILLPMLNLRDAALAVAKGERNAAERIQLNRKDELGDLSRALTKAIADLEASNKDLEGFSYSVSHDLRAPLRAIDGFLAILQDRYAEKLDPEGLRLFGIVSSNAQRMGHLIDDILAISRAGRLDLQRVSVDMGALVREVWAELEQQDSALRARLECDSLPHIDCDPRAMRQVWQNLLANAVKFSRGRANPVVHVSAAVEGSTVRYSVTDNGVGFNQAYSDKLFTLFQRLHGMDEFEGTGVGLAIVKRFVRKHGGEVAAQGVTDQGATFSFTLPTHVLAGTF